VLAARSNPEGTKFGAPVDAGAVRGAHSTYSVDAHATANALDILALFGTGNSSGGATVRAAGRSAKTDRQGHVTLTLKKGRATASAPGYAPAKLRVR
jgi:hypothetical protein